MSRTTPNFTTHLMESEVKIKQKLIPAITGRDEPNENDRILFSLPIKNGGLNFQLPTDYANDYNWSMQISDPLRNGYSETIEAIQKRITADASKAKQSHQRRKLAEINEQLNQHQKYGIELATQKGASSWLNALPLERYDFFLNTRYKILIPKSI